MVAGNRGGRSLGAPAPVTDARVAQLAMLLAEVHQGDGDELGVAARMLITLLEAEQRCTWTGTADGVQLQCTGNKGHSGWHAYDPNRAREWRERELAQ